MTVGLFSPSEMSPYALTFHKEKKCCLMNCTIVSFCPYSWMQFCSDTYGPFSSHTSLTGAGICRVVWVESITVPVFTIHPSPHFKVCKKPSKQEIHLLLSPRLHNRLFCCNYPDSKFFSLMGTQLISSNKKKKSFILFYSALPIKLSKAPSKTEKIHP